MKKIMSLVVLLGILTSTVYAFDFPEPDWGALYEEREAMDKTSELELYVEGNPDTAPYYGAKLEPRSGTYIGVAADGAEPFKPLGAYLTYVESYSQPDLYHDSKIMISSDDVVAMIGWTVTSMDDVDYAAIRRMLDTLQGYNKPMFIRFANEMNCSPLGDDPQKYIDVFRKVADMVHEYPNFAVVWSPNDLGALDRPFEYFYPGDEYVDWVGVSCYMSKYFTNDVNTSLKNSVYFMTGDYAWATNKIKPLMDFMANNHINKPIMVSEGGVARYNSFGDDYTGWNEPRLRNMLWYLIMKYPQIKMINYFNVKFNTYGEHYYISDYPESVNSFKEAADNGAYLRSAADTPSFVFSPANAGETLSAKDGIVKLYTYAYFDKQSEAPVTYELDGNWYHSANTIPYICRLDIGALSDGAHTLTIAANGKKKEYSFIKRDNRICFAGEPAAVAPASNDAAIRVFINQTPLQFDQPPVLKNDRVLVPMRAIFEALGAEVDWDGATQTAFAVRGGKHVQIQIGSNELTVDGAVKTLDVPAQLINDRTLVPLRAVSEAFDCAVSWDDTTQTASITD